MHALKFQTSNERRLIILSPLNKLLFLNQSQQYANEIDEIATLSNIIGHRGKYRWKRSDKKRRMHACTAKQAKDNDYEIQDTVLNYIKP